MLGTAHDEGSILSGSRAAAGAGVVQEGCSRAGTHQHTLPFLLPAALHNTLTLLSGVPNWG